MSFRNSVQRVTIRRNSSARTSAASLVGGPAISRTTAPMETMKTTSSAGISIENVRLRNSGALVMESAFRDGTDAITIATARMALMSSIARDFHARMERSSAEKQSLHFQTFPVRWRARFSPWRIRWNRLSIPFPRYYWYYCYNIV